MVGVDVVLEAGLPVEAERAELTLEQVRRDEVGREDAPVLELLLQWDMQCTIKVAQWQLFNCLY